MPVNMSLLYRAATHDLIADYAFGQGAVSFSREDLNAPYFEAYHEMVLTWHWGCYFPWFTHIIRRLPISLVVRLAPSVEQYIHMVQVRSLPLFSPLYSRGRTKYIAGSGRQNQSYQTHHLRRFRANDNLPWPPFIRSPRVRKVIHTTRRRSIRAALCRYRLFRKHIIGNNIPSPLEPPDPPQTP